MYTSLVFLVVLGIWAAYLVQQWMRRREHLLTARSVDAFTEALRVLERRPAATSTTTPERPRSYAVSPLRTRPEVVVKHAGSTSVSALREEARRTSGTATRAASLLVAAALLLVSVVATAAGLVGWYVPVAAALLLGCDIAYLRWSAKQASAARAERQALRPTDGVAGTVLATPESAHSPVDAAAAEPVTDDAVEVDSPAARPASPVLFDIASFDEPAPAPVVLEEPAPGTWRPTPVPAPLYTRKVTLPDLAPVGVPAPVRAAAGAESDIVLSPVDIDDDVLELESPFRQVVNG